MKIFKYLSLTVASVATVAMLYSCSEDLLDDKMSIQKPVVSTINAHPEGDGIKATYDGANINWDENDAISVFPEESSSNVCFNKKSGDNSSFECEGDIDLKNMFALFPYNASATLTDGQIKTVIKTTQTATPATFAPDANVSVGFSLKGDEVYFKNAVSYIKISYKTTVSDVSIRKITLQSLDESIMLTGNVVLTPTISEGMVTDVTTEVLEGGSNFVELSGDIQPNTDYYLVVAPVTLSEGFKIVFTDDKGNQFSKKYTADKNKAQLLRNTISSTGVKNLDNYEIDVEAYWRVMSTDEFTGGGDKYLLVKNTSASSTGYRIFDENKTDVFISSGTPLVDKFAIKGFSNMNTFQKGLALLSYQSKLSSWQGGGSAPVMMSHYVLYCFRQAYSDNGLVFGGNASSFIFNPEDAYSFTINTNSDSSLGKEVSFKLCYKNSGAKSMDVELTNCYLKPESDNSFKLCGRITQKSIDDLVTVFFLGKGSDFTGSISSEDIHQGADRAVNEDTIIGFCGTTVTTVDGTEMSNCFMVKNSKLCNTPEPESIWIYKKGIKQLSFLEYISI